MNEASAEGRPRSYESRKIFTGEVRAGQLDGKNGPIGVVSSVGVGREINEDVVAVNLRANAFAVIDGMGGYEKGEQAAAILAEKLQKGFEREISMSEVHRSASRRMRNSGIGKGGACYIAGVIRGNNLDIYQAGDVRLVVIDKNGTVAHQTEDENLARMGKANVLTNSVSGSKPGRMTRETIRLDVGDTVVVASDGLWDNLSPQQVSKVISKLKSPYQVVQSLKKYALARMKDRKKGKRDNLSILVYKIDKLAASYAGAENKGRNFTGTDSWGELYQRLDNLDGLQGSQKYYSSGSLKNIVAGVRSGDYPVDAVTRTGGLRKAVIKLLQK